MTGRMAAEELQPRKTRPMTGSTITRGRPPARTRATGHGSEMSDLPAPLVGPEVDLRHYKWFPLYHKRLRQSAFWKRASDAACRISVDFWAEAYEQVPAGSLPDDDYVLAEWAGFGRRELDDWLKIKPEVMRAWVRCSDGRWYHPTLSEVARAAWSDKLLHDWKHACDRVRKANFARTREGKEPLPMPSKPVPSVGPAPFSDGTDGLSDGSPSESPLKEKKRKTKTSSLRSEDVFVDNEDHRYSALAARWKDERPGALPERQGGPDRKKGWNFPPEWIEDLRQSAE